MRADHAAASSTGRSRSENRIGDHRWWISDLAPFKRDYPEWGITYDIEAVLREIYEHNLELWTAAR